ncbi:hypothetical protein INR49_029543 [Caranx melampygus]|nr:hypothetical protein INR49_029543 [Caranx melampygus]
MPNKTIPTCCQLARPQTESSEVFDTEHDELLKRQYALPTNYKINDMWIGLLHHVTGEHEWSLDACQHGPLEEDREKEWMEKGSVAHEALYRKLYNKKSRKWSLYTLKEEKDYSYILDLQRAIIRKRRRGPWVFGQHDALCPVVHGPGLMHLHGSLVYLPVCSTSTLQSGRSVDPGFRLVRHSSVPPIPAVYLSAAELKPPLLRHSWRLSAMYSRPHHSIITPTPDLLGEDSAFPQGGRIHWDELHTVVVSPTQLVANTGTTYCTGCNHSMDTEGKKLKGGIQRSTETGLAVEMPSRTVRQASHESIEDSMNSYGSEGNVHKRRPTTSSLKTRSTENKEGLLTGELGADFSDFLDGMGPAQFVGRQTLATTSMGEIFNMDAPNGQPPPLGLEAAEVVESPEKEDKKKFSCIIRLCGKRRSGQVCGQVIVWGNYGRMDRKCFMGVARILLEELDLSTMVISWYKLFPTSSMVDPTMAPLIRHSSQMSLESTIAPCCERRN